MTRPYEREYQDALFESPEAFLREAFPEDPPYGYIRPSREYPTRAGRADLAFFTLPRIVIVELKRDLIDDAAVVQCLRYVGAVREESLYPDTVSGVVAAPRFTISAVLAARGAGLRTVAILPFGEVCRFETSDEMQRAHADAIVDAEFASWSDSDRLGDEAARILALPKAELTAIVARANRRE